MPDTAYTSTQKKGTIANPIRAVWSEKIFCSANERGLTSSTTAFLIIKKTNHAENADNTSATMYKGTPNLLIGRIAIGA